MPPDASVDALPLLRERDRWALPLAACILAVVATWPLALHPSTQVLQGTPGAIDSSLNTWSLAWAADRLAHGLVGFWSPPVFYPYPHALAYSESLLGIAVFVAPILWAGGSQTFAYNCAWLLAYAVSAAGAWLLALEVTRSRAGAAIGALAFVLLPYRAAQADHLQVQWIGWLPIALWALTRLLQRPSWTMAGMFAAAAVLQVLSYGYAAFMLGIATVVLVVWHAVVAGLSRSALKRLAATATVAVAALLPALLVYQGVWADRAPTGEVYVNAADVSTYLSVADTLPAAAWLPGRAQPEGRLFPGVAVLCLAAIALAPARGGRWPQSVSWHRTGPYWLLAVVALWVSLGPAPAAWGRALPIPSLYAGLAAWTPLFHIVRVPARFGALVLLAVSMCAAAGAARLSGAWPASRACWGVLVIGAVIMFEGIPRPRPMRAGVPELAADERAAYEWLAAAPDGAVLELPIGSPGRVNYGLRAALGALVHQHPVINGLSRLETPLQRLLGGSASPLSTDDDQAAALPLLQGLDVRYLVVRPSRYRERAFGDRTLHALRASPAIVETRDFGEVSVLLLSPDDSTGSIAPPGVRPIPSASLTLRASANEAALARAVDGDLRSRWLTGRPQDGHEWLRVDFDRPRDVERLEMAFSERSLQDYPRRLRVESLEAETGAASVLYEGAILRQLGQAIRRDPLRPALTLALPRNRSRSILLRQEGVAEPWYWSIDELTLWERP